MENAGPLPALSDEELMRRLHDLAGRSRRVEADLVAHIGEVDARRLWAREAVSSMFRYCTERLHLSEDAAYRRIEVARAARRHPRLLDFLRDGRLHLTGLSLLARHLTAENRDGLLERATHQPKRRIEELIAELSPKPDVPATVRKLPERALEPASPPGSATSTVPVPSADGAKERVVGSLQLVPGRVTVGNTPRQVAPVDARPAASRPTVVPLAPARYKVQFTASAALRDKLERLQALMRNAEPGVDLATAIETAVTEKLERLEARRFAKTNRPRKNLAKATVIPTSRNIPAPIRRAVHERDGGRCRYVDASGRRCTERRGLEFHHRHPYGLGGDHSVDNLALYCRAHNALLAELDYGSMKTGRSRPTGEDCVREAAPTCAGGA